MGNTVSFKCPWCHFELIRSRLSKNHIYCGDLLDFTKGADAYGESDEECYRIILNNFANSKGLKLPTLPPPPKVQEKTTTASYSYFQSLSGIKEKTSFSNVVLPPKIKVKKINYRKLENFLELC